MKMLRTAIAAIQIPKRMQIQVNEFIQRFGYSLVNQQPQPEMLVNEVAEQQPDVDDVGVRLVHIDQDYKLHKLSSGPDMVVPLTRQDAALFYRQLLAIRRLEEAAAQLYSERLVRGFCHLYTGQEACAVGLSAAMRKQDSLIAGYRIHGLAYLRGVSAVGILAELTGRSSGCARGKGGSMHMYAPQFYGGNGIVGAQVALGTGLALSHKYQNDGGVCLALYGDGAANQGQIFECFNMAQLWKMPIVFVCENNNYGMGTSVCRASSNTKYYTRGDSLPGIRADGLNILAVLSAARFAIEYAQQRGPLILELCTYRYAGHSMSDPGTSYRNREEVQTVRQNHDAIDHFRKICHDYDLLSQEQLQEIKLDVRREMDIAIKAAKNDAELPLSHLGKDVYAGDWSNSKLRGVNEFNLEHARTASC